eukprot:15414065-Alexandrium_andersonii.AAC.1
MSASLVGSEMCIRDRLSSWPGAGHGSCRLLCPHPASQALKPARLAEPASVSYTHLTLPTICSV